MTPSPGKQKELLEREKQFEQAALDLLSQGGFQGLTMDKVAAATGFSKGTLYQHYDNKEDLVLSLCLRCHRDLLAYFNTARQFQGRPREIINAIFVAYQTYIENNPQQFSNIMEIKSQHVREKASPSRLAELAELEQAVLGSVALVIVDAIQQGDLSLGNNITPAEVTFGLWALSLGGFTIMRTSTQLDHVGLPNLQAALQTNLANLLDGYSWHPLSTEWDYDATRARITQELSPRLEQLTRDLRSPS